MNLILKPLVQLLQNERKINLTKFEYYKLYLIHEKKIYEKLNDMKLHHTFYEAVIYIESKNIELVATELHLKLVDDQMPSPQFIPIEAAQKPTLFDLNAVTRSPYEVLSAYGTPHYKEVNPAIFNLVTFPFMFGVMFGDIVHGLVLLAFGLLLILSESMRNPILDSLRPHRFTIALMGFFSFYCGLIYNEYLSLSLNLFGSCYEIEGEAAVLTEGCVYSIGVDPVWSISLNGLNFTNSLKMKMAVIIAIAHMSLGIVLKSVNYWHFNKKIHILIEVLPQLAFLLSVFGYMDFLIVFKWLHAWTGGAPSIITTMINIPLELGGTTDCCGGEPLWGTYGTTSQDKLQLFLLSLAMISIPIMFAFPLAYEYLQRRVKQRQDESLDFNEELANSKAIEREQLIESANSEEEMPLKEIAVYQFIETIEFVLGCISNTASYLRLWALSLAHSQLSEVFFESTVERGLENGFLGILYVPFPLRRI
jgi:V-type H+-transporting ATPase subunit a